MWKTWPLIWALILHLTVYILHLTVYYVWCAGIHGTLGTLNGKHPRCQSGPPYLKLAFSIDIHNDEFTSAVVSKNVLRRGLVMCESQVDKIDCSKLPINVYNFWQLSVISLSLSKIYSFWNQFSNYHNWSIFVDLFSRGNIFSRRKFIKRHLEKLIDLHVKWTKYL